MKNIFILALASFTIFTSSFSHGVEPLVGDYEYDLCQPLSSMPIAAKECSLWQVGEWAGPYAGGCINKTDPSPWASISSVISKATAWNETSTGLTGWLAPGQIIADNGCWNGPPVYTYGVESSNISLMTAGGLVVRRDRKVSCPEGEVCESTSTPTTPPPTMYPPYTDDLVNNTDLGNPNDSCPSNGTANPINTSTGNKFFGETIYQGGGEFPLVFKLFYNSRRHLVLNGEDIIHGQWSHSYSQHLVHDTANNVVKIIRSNGNTLHFYYEQNNNTFHGQIGIGAGTADGPFVQGININGEFSHSPDGTGNYIFKSHDGVEETYDTTGRLTRIRNLQGGGTHVIEYNLPTALDLGAPDVSNLGQMTITYLERGESITVAIGKMQKAFVSPDVLSEFDQFYYSPRSVTTPSNKTIYMDFVPSDSIVSTKGVTIFGSNLENIRWLDGSKTTYEYNHVSAGVGSSIYHYPSAVTDKKTTDSNGLIIYHQIVNYSPLTFQATMSQVGNIDVAERDYVYIPISSLSNTSINVDVTNKFNMKTTFTYTNWQNMFNRLTSINGGITNDGLCYEPNTTYAYNTNGQLSVKVNKNDYRAESGAGNRMTLYNYYYDVNWGLPNSVTQADRVVNYGWETSNNAHRQISSKITSTLSKEYTYEHGRIKTRKETDLTTDPVAYVRENSKIRNWTYDYQYHGADSDGLHRVQTLTETTPRNAQTIYTYSTKGDLIHIANYYNHNWSFYSHNEFGKPGRMTGPNGENIFFQYDLSGRLTQINAPSFRFTVSYFINGKIQRLTQGDGSFLEYEYTDGGRINTITNHKGEKQTVDRLSRTSSQYNFQYDEIVIKTFTSTNEERMNRQMLFDALGRLWKMYDLGGITSGVVTREFQYHGTGDIYKETESNSNIIVSVFDNLGRNYSRSDYAVDGSNRIVNKEFDEQDNVKRITDPEGLVTTYDYDGFGDLLQSTNTSTGTTKYYHDDHGNLSRVQDSELNNTIYKYDMLDRLTDIDYVSQDDEKFIYDETFTNGIGNFGIGKLTSMRKGTGPLSIAWIYDSVGNKVQDLRFILGRMYTTKYSYDNSTNKVKTIQYPSGQIIEYRYLNGEVDSIYSKNREVAIVKNILSEPFGPVKSFQYGNGLNYNIGYDAFYRVDTLNSGTGISLDYDYDSSGNVDLVTDLLLGTRTQDFGYDLHDRLEIAEGSYGKFEYKYDKIGNRTIRNWQQGLPGQFQETYTYPKDSTGSLINQRLDSVDKTGSGATIRSFGYQDTGYMNTDSDLASVNQYNYVYMDNGLPETVTNSNGLVARYAYNPLMQRESKYLGVQGTRHYTYGLNGELLYEKNLQTNLEKSYVYFQGKLVSILEGNTNLEWTASQVNSSTLPATVIQNGTSVTPNCEGSYTCKATLSVAGNAGVSALFSNIAVYTGQQIKLSDSSNHYAGLTYSRSQSRSCSYYGCYYYTFGTAKFYGYLNNTVFSYNISPYYHHYRIQYSSMVTRVYGSNDGYSWDYLTGFYGYMSYNKEIELVANYGNPINEVVITGIVPDKTKYNYVHADHLGTPLRITNSARQVVWDATYDPFGDAQIITETFENNVRFPGQYYDAETELHYNYFRYYDPSTGRYITSDPIGLQGGLNTYGYVGGNPTNWVDPYGLATQAIGYGIGRLVIAPAINIGIRYLTARRALTLGDWLYGVLNESADDDLDDSKTKQCDDTPIIIDDGTKTEDKVKNSIKSRNQDLIDIEMAKEKTLTNAQNKRRKNQRRFKKGAFEGNYDDFLDSFNKP